MGFNSKLLLALGGILLGMTSASSIQAATMTYSGSFQADDQIQLINWVLPQATDVVLQTYSYAGGTAGNGNHYSAGGFVPVISLFDATGMLLGSDGGSNACATSHADAATGLCNDAYFSEDLKAGSYTVALSEFFNVPNGPNLTDGFLMQGAGNFTGQTCGTTGAFYETDLAPCVKRDGDYAIALSSVPEPATIWLTAVPAIALGIYRRRRQSRSK